MSSKGTKSPKLSVIIPTHNRQIVLAETLSLLANQTLPSRDYEVVVVDDGSRPAVSVPSGIRLVRLEGEERSRARNAGARSALGELLVFIDDDIRVGPDFLEAHWAAHGEWANALLVGSIRLPEDTWQTPFGRFRQRLEDTGIPQLRGLTSMSNFCTAANMAIPKHIFENLGGFDPLIASSEDQDLALRHTSAGGRIAFVPEARVVHCDNALDVESYCRRVEWGSRMMIPFCRRYPDFRDNQIRREVNGAPDFVKELLSSSLARWFLFKVTGLLERLIPESPVLDRLYRGLIGIHTYRGYREGDEAWDRRGLLKKVARSSVA